MFPPYLKFKWLRFAKDSFQKMSAFLRKQWILSLASVSSCWGSMWSLAAAALQCQCIGSLGMNEFGCSQKDLGRESISMNQYRNLTQRWFHSLKYRSVVPEWSSSGLEAIWPLGNGSWFCLNPSRIPYYNK